MAERTAPKTIDSQKAPQRTGGSAAVYGQVSWTAAELTLSGELDWMKGILRWKCHICKVKFVIESGEGNVCANCYDPTCNRHLSAHKVKEKTLYICSNCLTKSTNM
jgi:DNA-directed RNA polymerase subunit RPC12/RpoP